MIEHVEDTTNDHQPYVPQEVTDSFPANLSNRLTQLTAVTSKEYDNLDTNRFDPPPNPPPHDSWGDWEDSVHIRWAKKGWLATRMMSVHDEMGIAAEYLLPSQVWDYEVEVDVPGDKYPHWGSFMLDGGAELTTGEAQMMRQLEAESEDKAPPSDVVMAESNSQSGSDPTTAAAAATASTPTRAAPSILQSAIETASLAELRAARPHDALFFNPVDRSWVLFARAPPKAEQAHLGPSTVHNTWRSCAVSAPRLQKLAIPPPIQPAKVANEEGSGVAEVEFDLTGAMRQEVAVWEGAEGDDVIVSKPKFYPLVISEELWLALEGESAPKPGDMSSVVGFFRAVQMIWRVIDGLLFLGKGKSLPVRGKGFSKAITWSPTASAIFVDTLGFVFHGTSEVIVPPVIDTTTQAGRANRARLLRAWLETGLMIESAKKNDGKSQLAMELVKE